MHISIFKSASVQWSPCCLVTKSCPTLCDFMDYSLPDSSVHGISQAKILGWIAISFSIHFFKNKFFFGCAAWHVGFYFPDQGWNPYPLHWKHKVFFFLIYNFIYVFIFGCTGSSSLPRLFSSCGKRGLLSSCVKWGLLSSCGVWTS